MCAPHTYTIAEERAGLSEYNRYITIFKFRIILLCLYLTTPHILAFHIKMYTPPQPGTASGDAALAASGVLTTSDTPSDPSAL